MSKVLFDEQPIVVDKVLARKLGLNEAIVIQQVNYWLKINEKKNQNFINGRYWTYNTIKEWHENNFEYWSLDTVKRTFTRLENLGLIVVGNFNKDRRDRTKWYSIDYEKLDELISQNPETKKQNTVNRKSAKCPNAKADSVIHCKSAKCPNAKVQNALMQKCKMPQPLPETNYTEITNRDRSMILSDHRSGHSPDGAQDQDLKMPNNKDLIAELTNEYRKIEVVPKDGDFAVIGDLYNRFGYAAVLEGLGRLEQALAKQEIKKPLIYLKAILENKKSVKNQNRKIDSAVKNDSKQHKKKLLIQSLYMN